MYDIGRKIYKKSILTISLIAVIISTLFSANWVYAENDSLFTDGQELSTALIEEKLDGGKLTASEKEYLLDNSSDEAQVELAETAISESMAVLSEENPTLENVTYLKETFNLDCGGTCTITLIDEEDLSFMDSILGALNQVFFQEVYADSVPPQVLWKAYGARQFTAWIDIAFLGGIKMTEVIHYNISDAGLTVTGHEALNDPPWGLYRIWSKSSALEDKYAEKVGYDIHAAGSFVIYKDIQGFWTPDKTKLVRAKVQLMGLDKSGKRAQVYQILEYENL